MISDSSHAKRWHLRHDKKSANDTQYVNDNESNTCQSKDNMKETLIRVKARKAIVKNMKTTLVKTKVHESDNL